MTDEPLKSGVITYPAFIDECAVYIGKLRDLINYDMNEQNPRFKRGDQTESVNILGVRGELIFSYYLHSLNKSHTMVKLLSHKPIASCDIVIGDRKIDVKTVRPYAVDLLVNVEAHKKKRDVNAYVFVKPGGNCTAQFWMFDRKQIDSWPIKDANYSDAYYRKITDCQ